MIAIHSSTTAFPMVVPAWFYALGLLGMCVALSAAYAEFRTVRVRVVLAAVLLAIALSSADHALSVGDPCRVASGILYWLIGCAF